MSEITISTGHPDAGRIYAEALHRVTAERDGLQISLNTADQSIDELNAAISRRTQRVRELETALAGMLFAFDDGVGREWSEDLLDFARKLTAAKEFKAALKPAEGGGDDWKSWAVGNTVRYQGSGQDGEDCYCRMRKCSDYLIHEAPDDHESMVVLDDDGDELCVLVGEFKWIKP